jgi:hypothetical protein
VADREPAWTYEPDRLEAGLHVAGWVLFALVVVLMVLGFGAAVALIGVFGLGWIACLAAMGILARRRTGMPWRDGWSDDVLARAWRIQSYALRPWKAGHSAVVLGRSWSVRREPGGPP